MLKVGFEVIPLVEVCQNSYILVGSRYKATKTGSKQHQMVSLGDKRYFTVCSGGTPSSSIPEYWNGGVNWITLADLPAQNFVTMIKETERTISETGLKNSNARLLPVDTVVVSTRATIGRVGIAKTQLATNQGFKNIIIERPSEILPEYLAYVLLSKTDEMISLASGATFKEISKENFCTLQIPLLPLEQQKSIIAEFESYQKAISDAQAIIDSYTAKIESRIKTVWEE